MTARRCPAISVPLSPTLFVCLDVLWMFHIRFDRRPITFDGEPKGGCDQADQDKRPENDDNRFHEPKFWHAMTSGKSFWRGSAQPLVNAAMHADRPAVME